MRTQALFLPLCALVLASCRESGESLTPQTYQGQYVASYCLQGAGCGCEVSGVECETRATENIAPQLEAIERLGLQFDADCAARKLDRMAARACESWDSLAQQVLDAAHDDPDLGCLGCSVVHGDREVGMGSDQQDETGVSNCASGLSCVSGVCVDTCRVALAGERCWSGQRRCSGDDDGLSFCSFQATDVLTCAAGLLCAADTDFDQETAQGFCRPPQADGETCAGGGCSPGSYCDFDEEFCVSLLDAGDACSSPWECVSGLCEDEICAPTRPVACLPEAEPAEGDDTPAPPPMLSELEGNFLLAMHLAFDPDHPLQFIVHAQPDGEELELVFVPLSLDLPNTLEPRERLVPVFDSVSVEMSDDGELVFELPEFALPGEANPISGSDMVLSLLVSGRFEGPDTLCATAAGELSVPFLDTLDGTSVTAIRLDNELELPPRPTRSSAGPELGGYQSGSCRSGAQAWNTSAASETVAERTSQRSRVSMSAQDSMRC